MAAMGDSVEMDYKAHNQTYAGFIGLVKWGTVLSLAVAAIVVTILVS